MRTLVTLVLIAVILAITNPPPDSFKAMVEERASEIVSAETGGGKIGQIVGDLAGGTAAGAIMRVTDRKNYYVASVYTIDLDGIAGTENEWKFLGIATQFVELQRPAVLGK